MEGFHIEKLILDVIKEPRFLLFKDPYNAYILFLFCKESLFKEPVFLGIDRKQVLPNGMKPGGLMRNNRELE